MHSGMRLTSARILRADGFALLEQASQVLYQIAVTSHHDSKNPQNLVKYEGDYKGRKDNLIFL